MNLSLLIDTGTEQGVVAFAEEGQILWEEKLPLGLHNSRYVMPAIQRGSSALSVLPKDLAYIAVGVGPGSYTGIRVAASVAKTLSYALSIPVVGVSTLAGFASAREEKYGVLLDAKIGGVYFAIGERSEGAAHLITEPELVELEKIDKKISEIPIFVSPHVLSLQTKVSCIGAWEEGKISSKLLAVAAYDKYRKGASSDQGRVELLYLRKTQAEIEKQPKMAEPVFLTNIGKDVQSVLMKLAKSLCSQYVNILTKRDL